MKLIKILLCVFAVILSSCKESDTIAPVKAEEELSEEYYSGGKNGTVFNATSSCFQQSAPGISDIAAFKRGEQLFDSRFVSGSNTPFSGLGPLYIRSSCISCHPGYGRGRRVTSYDDDNGNGYLVFVHNPDGSIVNGFTSMLQTHAVPPFIPPVQTVNISWHRFSDEHGNKYPDGSPYNEGKSFQGTLIYPTAELVGCIMDLPNGYKVSIESTIGIYGTGLLDAIKDDDIIAEYTRQQSLAGQIKGQHGAWITEPFDGQQHLGKFTWNCTRATLENGPGINALYSIFNLTRKDKPTNYITAEWVSKMAQRGIDTAGLLSKQPVEITQEQLNDFMVWHRGLAVPAARNLNDAAVQKGKKLFYEASCNQCHKPSWTTGEYKYVPGFSNQKIWPYTDLLMHYMGEEVQGRYKTFRTPPLWGRGLMMTAANHTDMFHDLRARDFEEAILWHFGEGKISREFFRNLSKDDRKALIKFLEAI